MTSGSQATATSASTTDVEGFALIDENTDFDTLTDPSRWAQPEKYFQHYSERTSKFVTQSIASDQAAIEKIRNEIFPDALSRGVIKTWQAIPENRFPKITKAYLTSGMTAAVDGNMVQDDNVAYRLGRIVVVRTSYSGQTNTMVNQLFLNEFQVKSGCTVDDIATYLEGKTEKRREAQLSNVVLYAIMTAMERKLATDRTQPWVIGQGTVFPHELLTGCGRYYMLQKGTDLIREFIDTERWALVTSADSHREVLSLGLALQGGEYLVLQDGRAHLDQFRQEANYTTTKIPQYSNHSQYEVFDGFRNDVAEKVVFGIFRCHNYSPPYTFWSHRDHFEEAMNIVMADAYLSGVRGFPLIIDYADRMCSGMFPASEFRKFVRGAAIGASGTAAYLSERQTR